MYVEQFLTNQSVWCEAVRHRAAYTAGTAARAKHFPAGTVLRVCRGLLHCLFLVAVTSARGSVYDDGLTHTIFGPETDVAVSNGTTVNIVPGAMIMGTNDDPIGHSAVQVFSSILNVTGGSMTGSESKAGGDGLSGFAGQYNISAGAFQGGHGSSLTGGAGAAFHDSTTLSISGGNFVGGDGDSSFGGLGGSGVIIDVGSPLTATISGGTFRGGAGAGTGGADLKVTGAATVNLSGGSFVGSRAELAGDSIGNLSGGSFSGRIEVFDHAVLHVTNGNYSGGFALYDTSLTQLTSGEIRGIEAYDSAIANVDGGHFFGTSLLNNNSKVNLTGGVFAGVEDFVMNQASVLNVFGTSLTLQFFGGPFPYWELQGTLQDTTPIDAIILRVGDNTTINLNEVPEPTSAMLAASGIFGLFAWSSRRKHYKMKCSTCRVADKGEDVSYGGGRHGSIL